MQFSISLLALFPIAMLASASPAVLPRNLHQAGYCIDIAPATSFKSGEEYTENNAATVNMCNAYKARNVGTAPEDSCPDCYTKTSGGVTTCNSSGNHLGGNEMSSLCKAAGADDSLGA